MPQKVFSLRILQSTHESPFQLLQTLPWVTLLRTSFLFRLSSPKSCSFDCPVYLHIYYIYLLRIVLEPRGFVKGELKFMKEVPKEMFTVIIVTFRTYILCWIILSKSVERCICERSMDVRRGARVSIPENFENSKFRIPTKRHRRRQKEIYARSKSWNNCACCPLHSPPFWKAKCNHEIS